MAPKPGLLPYKHWGPNAEWEESILGARRLQGSLPQTRTHTHTHREAKITGKTHKEESDVPRSFENLRAQTIIKISSLKQSA